MVHNKQPETKFQISELYFPSQLYQQNNKSTIEPSMTQSIPNSRSIYIYKEWAIRQKSNKWSTDSALQQHIQQRFSQRVTTKHKVIQDKNPTMSCCPREKSHPFKNLNFPNSFPRESGRSCISNLMIKGPSIKLHTAINIPTKFVTPFPRNSGLDEMKKGVGNRQLPIIEVPVKT